MTNVFTLTPLRAAAIVLAVAFATIAGAWVFEWAGYAPCDLCLKQRWAYYAGIPVALAAVLFAWRGPVAITRGLLVLLAVIFFASAVFGVYHAGVEWGLWQGPTGCTGGVPQSVASTGDFMKQLQQVKVVRCDVVALRIFGLSLAGWNAIISLGMAGVALKSGLSAEN